MKRRTNALAELAERLTPGLVINVNGCAIAKDVDFDALQKAQRIVEELAKVSDGRWEVICDGPPAYFCTAGDLKVQCAIGRCRAIAEERAEDGKRERDGRGGDC